MRRTPLSEQVCAGAIVALAAGLADAVVAGARGGTTEPMAGLGAATGHLVAMAMGAGLAAGVAIALWIGLVRGLPGLAPIRERLTSPARLFRRDPAAFAAGLAGLATAAVFFAAAALLGLHFSTRYHDPVLASLALAAVVLAVAVLAVPPVYAVFHAVAGALAALLGRLASAGAVVLIALGALAGSLAAALVWRPQLGAVLDPVALAAVPTAIVLWIAATFVLRRLAARPGGARKLARIASTAAAVVLLALVASAATYGDENRVRAWVERHSIAGKRLLRIYMGATDSDGDGHSFAFGGGDCDDGRADVHPGAPDPEGDGVDADCFDGDGSRSIGTHGDGAYGELPAELRGREPSVLLVTIDALRPDHLGCSGYERDVSPRIDALCEESVRFSEAFAQSSRSIRSIPSMFTGFYPSQIAYGDEYLWPSLLDENVTLAEVLRARGYRTAATMGTSYFERMGGFFQGFDDVVQLRAYRPVRDHAVDRALEQLESLRAQEGPWFLWVHLFNVHEEYLADGRASMFGDAPVDAYDTEIVLADREVGRLLDALGEDALRDTVVVIASDHGEAFGEHGNRAHSHTLYDEELRSVLMIRAPGFAPRVVEAPVGLLDVMPTLLNLASVPVPRPMPARSLVPLMHGGPGFSERPLFSELLPDGQYPYDQKAVRVGDMKLIWWVREGMFQLFDVARDRGEQVDLSDDRRQTAEHLLGTIRAWIAATNLPDNRNADVLERNLLDRPPARMSKPLSLRFPTFTVLGVDMPRRTFEPGDRIPVTLYYDVHAETDRDLFFYVDIVGPQGYRVPPHFHAHHYPINGRYRTYQWRAGDVIRDPMEIIVPEDIVHPVELTITLSVLDERRPVTFRHGGAPLRTIELGKVSIE